MKTSRRLVSPALLSLLPALFLIQAVGSGLTLYGSDLTKVFWHTRQWVTGELWAGRFPVWDPHVMAGFPLFAANQAAVLYPPSWLSLLLPDAAFWIVITWIHLAASGIFAEAWLRRGLGLGRPAALLGAAVFSLSGFLYAHLYAGHVNYVWAYPWGAALLWRLERYLAAPNSRRALLLALPTALMILAGVPQLALIAALAALARLVHFAAPPGGDRRSRLGLALAGAGLLSLSVLIAAPQVFATLELSREAHRRVVADRDFGTAYSLPPENLALLAAPTAAGDGVFTPYWGRWNFAETCGTVGLATLFLCAIGAAGAHRQRRLWAIVAILALVLALGRYTPVYRVFSLLPGVGMFRGPARYLYGFTLAASALAALGIERLRTERAGFRGVAAAIATAALLLCGSFWVGSTGDASWNGMLEKTAEIRRVDVPDAPPVRPEGTRAAARWALGAAGGVALLAAGLLAAGAKGWAPPERIALLFGLLVASELAVFSHRFVRSQSTEPLDWPPEVAAFIRAQPGFPYRIATVGASDVADTGRCRVAGLDHLGGYEPLLLQRYAELMNILMGRSPDHAMVLVMPFRPHPILAMLGARLWIAPPGIALPKEFRKKAELNGRLLLGLDTGLPRGWLAPRSRVIEDRDERLRALASEQWDPSTTVLLEEASGSDGAPGDVVLQSRSPGAYRFDVRSPAGGWVVLSESYYPGWTATVDGAPAPVLRANHLVQAVRVEPGTHDVRFEYHSRTLRLGFAVAALVLAGFGVATWRERWRLRPT